MPWVWRVFGATEIPTVTVAPVAEDDLVHASETDGRIWQAEVRVVHPQTGTPLPSGVEGEILAKSPTMAVGYAHSEDNLIAYDGEGFFRTGDLGRIVDDKYIVITGRKKDVIIRNGENISPKEIEDLLVADPRIADVAVVSKSTARIGEAVCAFIVPAAGQEIALSDLGEIVRAGGLANRRPPSIFF